MQDGDEPVLVRAGSIHGRLTDLVVQMVEFLAADDVLSLKFDEERYSAHCSAVVFGSNFTCVLDAADTADRETTDRSVSVRLSRRKAGVFFVLPRLTRKRRTKPS